MLAVLGMASAGCGAPALEPPVDPVRRPPSADGGVVVSLKATDREGGPIRRRELGYRVVKVGAVPDQAPDLARRLPGSVKSVQGTVWTDADGRFELTADVAWREGDERELVVWEERDDGSVRRATVDLSRALPRAGCDLGRVVLLPWELSVAGRVVDGRGVGVGGATLRLHRVGIGSASGIWNEELGFRHAADPDGLFAVRRETFDEDYRLHARSASGWSEPASVRPGDDDVQLEIEPVGSIAGSVVLAAGVDARPLTAEIVSSQPPDHARMLRSFERQLGLEDDGSFRFPSLLPGTYELRLTIRHGEHVRRIERVPVVGGERTVVPPADLRDELHAFPIELVHEGESVDLACTYSLCAAGGAGESYEGAAHSRELVLLSRSPEIDVTLHVKGFRDVRLERVTGRTTVELRRGSSVRLVLAPELSLPEPPDFLYAELRREAGASGSGEPIEAWFDEGKETVVEAPGPGTYRVTWHLGRTLECSVFLHEVRLRPQPRIELDDVEGEQVIELELTQEQMDEIVEALD